MTLVKWCLRRHAAIDRELARLRLRRKLLDAKFRARLLGGTAPNPSDLYDLKSTRPRGLHSRSLRLANGGDRAPTERDVAVGPQS